MTAPVVTVHTPTWNREGTLPRAYESLRAQTFTDFEWIVTDDASADGTLDLLRTWQREAPFPIRIFAFPHRVGKPRQDNEAARRARGRYFVQLGSDDTFAPEALATFVRTWGSIPASERDDFCTVAARSQYFGDIEIGPPFPQHGLDTTAFDLCYHLRLHAEFVCCHRTDVVRRFPYPEEDYVVPESVVWVHDVRTTLRMRCVNDVVNIGTQVSPNGISSAPKMHYCRGYAYGFAATLNDPLVPWRTVDRLRALVNLERLARHGGVRPREVSAWLSSPRHRVEVRLFAPLAWLIVLRDRLTDRVDNTKFVRHPDPPRAFEPLEVTRA